MSIAQTSDSYDAFISYSRSVDVDLATSLEKALKSFAKPVFSRRAIHVFRDDASLTARPSLWGGIESALSQSKYFILLASPDSAKSLWVKRELDWWLSHKGADSLIIVLTDGRIEWNSEATTSFPSEFFSKIPEEPRWVNLSWARKATDLSLRNPDFLSAVAEIAGWIRNQKKDELIGDDITNHRRQLAYAGIAAAFLIAFAITAVSTAAIAIHQASLADSAATRATSERSAAEAARDQAQIARTKAQSAEREALIQKDLAVASRNSEIVARERADREKIRAEKESLIAKEQERRATAAFRAGLDVTSNTIEQILGKLHSTKGIPLQTQESISRTLLNTTEILRKNDPSFYPSSVQMQLANNELATLAHLIRIAVDTGDRAKSEELASKALPLIEKFRNDEYNPLQRRPGLIYLIGIFRAIGKLDSSQGRHQDAINRLTYSLDLSTQSGQTLSVAYLIANQPEKAKPSIKDVIATFSGFSEETKRRLRVQHGLALLTHGDALQQTGDSIESESLFRQALDIFSEAVSENPTDLERVRMKTLGMERIANLMVLNGNFPQAEKLLDEVLIMKKDLLESDPSSTAFQRDVFIIEAKLRMVRHELSRDRSLSVEPSH